MSNTERKRVLNYRNDNGLAPNPDNIDYGEIAIGYKKDNEAIYIKNTANNIVDFTPISIVNITDSEGKTQNIGIKTNQGDSPIVQSLVSEKILSEGVVPEISLSYNTNKGLFDVTVTVKKGDTTVVDQKFYVTPVNN